MFKAAGRDEDNQATAVSAFVRLVAVCLTLVSCVSTNVAPEEYGRYMRNVVERVESVARQMDFSAIDEKLAAKVELVILADGSLEGAKIVQSSGNDEFDQIVIRLAYAASPFEPFPEEIRKETDILHIIRTWRYSPR